VRFGTAGVGRPRPPRPSWLAAALASLGALVPLKPVLAQAPTPTPAPEAAAAAATWALPALVLPSRRLLPLPDTDAERALPITLRAARIEGQPGQRTTAEGEVEFRRGSVVIRAERMSYDAAPDLARAEGDVRIERPGSLYRGTLLELQLERYEGFFLEPRFELLTLGSGGRAARVDFLDRQRSRATDAAYTSCPREDLEPGGQPAWVLQAKRVTIDVERQEGYAEGAVLRFQGVPIAALPAVGFPIGDARRSGWLPPSINLDTRSGLDLSVPWYWNIAPNLDATLAPRVITRRGVGLDSELRYLGQRQRGQVQLDWLPLDRVADRSRHAVHWLHQAELGRAGRVEADVLRASDDNWWKDFPSGTRSLSSRLLPQALGWERPLSLPLAPWLGAGAARAEGSSYARLQTWQVLQGTDAFIAAPYQRSPQLGVQLGADRGAWQWALQTEYNRFTLPHGQARGSNGRPDRPEGDRVHLLASLSRPWRDSGWWLVPRLALNAAHYRTERPGVPGADTAGRTIPTFSLDGGLELEREAHAFGRALLQTLEPRLVYVNTPFRAQSALPNYDSAARNINFFSGYADNAFSGVDRVSDSHQVTMRLHSRLLDAASGAELMQVGLAQRYLLRTQRVTPNPDGSADGPPLEQRFSDALLQGSTSVVPGWVFDGAVQYSPDQKRAARSVVSARWAPGPFRTVGATYRVARGLSEQLELGWQWPLAGPGAREGGHPLQQLAAGGSRCQGTWYSVGRVNFSMADSRVTDAIAGFEYDAGCWIGRVVAERRSTGLRDASTRLMLQLELVGLSRLGSNPLRVLKDNIPGYRLLREERSPDRDGDGAP
jgi:LPS-assembly protein